MNKGRVFRLLLCLLAAALLAGSAAGEKSILMTFTGDCTVGGEESQRGDSDSFFSAIAREGYGYPFARFLPMFSGDDCTVVNLEGVLSDTPAGENRKKTYRFRGDTAYTAVLAEASVEVCCLANNHVNDYGPRGLSDTEQALDAAGVGRSRLLEPYILEKDGIRVAVFAVDNSSYMKNSEQLRGKIRQMKADGEISAAVVCLHSGREYTSRHDEMQEKRGASLAKYGADLVIMHHPHVVQGVRIIGGSTICYSLGNFVFGGNSRIRTETYGSRTLTSLYSLVVQARLDFADDGAYLGQQVTLFPAFSSGDPVVNRYQPYPVYGEEAAAVIDAVQFDTDFELPALSEADGYAAVVLPYLPAETE